MTLLTPEQIKRMAAMQGRHAEERALLMGRQENERRELQAKQEEELLAERKKDEPAPSSPGLIPIARRPGGR